MLLKHQYGGLVGKSVGIVGNGGCIGIPGGVVGANGLVGKAPGGILTLADVGSAGADSFEPVLDVGPMLGVATYQIPPSLAFPWPVTNPAASLLKVCSGQPL